MNELGPDDLAAVVYTENNRTAQNLTTDRQRLLAAIETSAIFPGPRSVSPAEKMTADQGRQLNDPLGLMRGSCSCGVCFDRGARPRVGGASIAAQQRKIVIYISPASSSSRMMPRRLLSSTRRSYYLLGVDASIAKDDGRALRFVRR